MIKLLWVGIGAIILPFLLMSLEYSWALVSGASGERLASAGIWGVLLGYYLIPGGAVLLILVLLDWLLRRWRQDKRE